MSLDISLIKKEDGIFVLDLEGSIDNATSPQLKQQIDLLLAGNIKTLVLDLEGLKFMSSVGVGLINNTKTLLKKKNAEFAMVNPSPQIKKVFEIMSLLPTMNVFNSTDELDEYLDKIQHRITEEGTSLGS
ncbi:MAG: STAS domain-containing protein [SAR324 cluster bacterium]|nr:STAS domain-containing protein [SAR324 cluster bacterium]